MNTVKVLVVEDDPIIAKDISSLLKSEGYTIVGVAHDGSMALDFLKNRTPDFIILDIYLGTGMSGIDIAEVVHEKYNIPFIFLTSFSDEETLEAAQLHSPYGYLVKPFQDRTLLTTISLALSNFQRQQKGKGLDQARIPDRITKQELKLIEELVKGQSNKQISENLFISINTVKYHLKNIYQKFEVTSKAELLSKLLQ